MLRRKALPLFLSLLVLSFIILLIGCGGSGGSSEGEADSAELVSVSGYVNDINGNPVEGAEVTISSDPITVITDAEGYFSANVEAGPHEIIITKGALTIYSSTFNCGDNEPLDLDAISTSYDPNNQDDDDGDGFASDDCNDGDPSINPGETETPYNGKDDDCNPNTLDDDMDQDGYQNDTDCDDNNGSVNPGATEVCDDLKDNDCDGDIDDADSDCINVSPTLDGTVLYFEQSRMLMTTGLNGKVLDNGFSFSGWFYFIRLPAENGDIIIGNEFGITYQDEKSVELQLKDTGTNITGIAMEKWINLAVTYDLSTANYFVNGTLVETAQASGPFVFYDGEGAMFSVGSFGIQSFYGYVSQFKIWNRGLSAEELNTEIARSDSSGSEGIEHQWLFNEGRGNKASDSVGSVNFDIVTPYWIDLDGPYEIVHDSMLRISDENKMLPFNTVAFGSADLNQDGFPDLFYHGSFADPPTYKTPLLALQNDGSGNFNDASDGFIDGGLYYKRVPNGRETIIADLNDDGFEDIFIGQTGEHWGVGEYEADCLLLSNGNSGKLYPSESTIMSPPCTLDQPEFDSQKPCSSNLSGSIYYPDNSAPLVPIDIRSHNNATFGDIDNDDDMDIFVDAGNDEEWPVLPYFLINDGKGNFTANWQMVPNKAFRTKNYVNEIVQSLDAQYVIVKLEDLDGDGFLDLVLFDGGGSGVADHIPSDPFDVEQDYWDASVHDLIAWGADGGFSETYTILERDSLLVEMNNTIITADIDLDGDLDIIATKQINNGGQYLQVFSNNGDRTFTDVTQQSIPQDHNIAMTLKLYSGEMREIDFNEDQCPDFYQQAAGLDCDPFDQPYIMWLNNCKGYFTPIERRFIGKMGLLVPIDADGDGDIDFVSQTAGGDSSGNGVLEYTLLRRTRDINMDKYIDTDRDGLNDIDDTDDDGDGVNDSEDAFPKDQYQS